MTISEPMTMTTDYILASASVVFAIGLARVNSHRFWRIGFFCAAAAALIGGTFHGFAAYQTAALHKALWDVTMMLIGATAGFMVCAALSSPLKSNVEKSNWLKAGVGLTLVGFFIQQAHISLHSNFNHNDLFHSVQTVAFYFVFRGARLN